MYRNMTVFNFDSSPKAERCFFLRGEGDGWYPFHTCQFKDSLRNYIVNLFAEKLLEVSTALYESKVAILCHYSLIDCNA